MENDVHKTIDASIERLAGQVGATVDGAKAVQLSEAAENLAKTKAILHAIKPVGSSESKKTS